MLLLLMPTFDLVTLVKLLGICVMPTENVFSALPVCAQWDQANSLLMITQFCVFWAPAMVIFFKPRQLSHCAVWAVHLIMPLPMQVDDAAALDQ